ncbi:hypothetical protein BC938DRAFT_478034 [Jimgerdemannia flammicorona]|uniref:Uncharacterized protein n=1 Tax=Jimgerdemannia flammicorona TaxID=994334 RepID=A0A433P6P8_9FUNG|nr:hypothetical protein BC938DRAFT_478034 [Jimgerdemannia flammicorona]
MSPNTPSELQLPPEPIPQPSTSTSSIHPGSQGFQANGIEKEEIWSTILTSVASSKLVPAKNVLILGKHIPRGNHYGFTRIVFGGGVLESWRYLGGKRESFPNNCLGSQTMLEANELDIAVLPRTPHSYL